MIEEGRRGEILRACALEAIASALGQPFPAGRDLSPEETRWLQQPGAVFVTLLLDGELRGCIGSLEARRSLGEDVAENAMAAAFQDPRFPPLEGDAFPRLTLEVSLLSPLEELPPCPTREAAEALLRPGVDGLLLTHGGHRGTFLPQVWETLPTPERYLEGLLRKAGLPLDFWSRELQLYRYTVEKYLD